MKACPAAAARLKPCHGDLTLESQMEEARQNGARQVGLPKKEAETMQTREA